MARSLLLFAVVVVAVATAAVASATTPGASSSSSLTSEDERRMLVEQFLDLRRRLQLNDDEGGCPHGAVNVSAEVADAVTKEENEETAAASPNPMDPVFNNTIMVIVLVLIVLSVLFEQMKDAIEEGAGVDMEAIVAQMVCSCARNIIQHVGWGLGCRYSAPLLW